MKILLVNKYNYVTGGADTYYFLLRELLKRMGHEVAEFCLNCSENVYSEYVRFFVFGLTFRNWKSASILSSLKEFINCIYNFEAKKKFKALLDSFEPDIIHIQNIFYQISPSILSAAKKKNIPVIETLHDYHLVCASNNFYHHGKICEDCLTKSLLSIILNKCYNDSFRASLLAFTGFMFRKIFKIYENRITCWISPSCFLRDKMIRCGIDPNKIRIVSNYIQSDGSDASDEAILSDGLQADGEEFILFIGRLEEYKGLWSLIKVAENLNQLRFIIAGDGTLKSKIVEYIRMRNIKNIELSGFVGPEEIKKLIRSSRFIVVPSEWYEVFGLVILEAYKYGKPVIASRIGGIPDIVNDDTGILLDPGNVLQLYENIKELYYNRDLRARLTRNIKEKFKINYSSRTHYLKLMQIYKEVINASIKY